LTRKLDMDNFQWSHLDIFNPHLDILPPDIMPETFEEAYERRNGTLEEGKRRRRERVDSIKALMKDYYTGSLREQDPGVADRLMQRISTMEKKESDLITGLAWHEFHDEENLERKRKRGQRMVQQRMMRRAMSENDDTLGDTREAVASDHSSGSAMITATSWDWWENLESVGGPGRDMSGRQRTGASESHHAERQRDQWHKARPYPRPRAIKDTKPGHVLMPAPVQ
jgi:hypothetical protein